MKTASKFFSSLVIASALMATITACNKENSIDGSSSDNASVAASEAIAVAASTSSNDSVYVVQPCSRNYHRDTVAAANLSASITTYLTTNYAGYSFQKAFAVNQNNTNATSAFVVIIQYNGKPVGLQFDANGNFVKVLEQREGRDFHGRGWHRGGWFEHRDGLQRDTIALTALPVTVTVYMAANYTTDTLHRAYLTHENKYVVISFNNGVYASLFNADGSFAKRMQLPAHSGKYASIEVTALPAAAQTYLTTTYPGYVFNKAFAAKVNGVVQGYIVLIDANNTRYAIQFDASGNFIKVKTIL